MHGRNTLFRRPDSVNQKLYVITPIFNSQRYRSRWRLYENFAKQVEDAGGILYTVEVAFGNREFSITQPDNVRHIQLRARDELWLKENMLNIAISRLPSDWLYVATIDADIQFTRPDWVGETIQKLQHYHIVQMFSHAIDLGPRYEPIMNHKGFMYCYLNNIPKNSHIPCYYYNLPGSKDSVIKYHPGFAHAYRRSAINYLGGLVDFCPTGAADNHMCHAFIGKVLDSIHPQMDKSYKDKLLIWQARAEKYIQRNIGYVDGTILHYWHGKKVDRRYWDRWKILTGNKFNPDLDLKRDHQLLWQFSERNYKLRDEIRIYFSLRNEDSIDT